MSRGLLRAGYVLLCLIIGGAFAPSASALSAKEKQCRDGTGQAKIAACNQLLATTSDPMLRAMYHNNKGFEYGFGEIVKCDEARAEFREAIRIYPIRKDSFQFDLRLRLGLVAFDCGDVDTAVEVASQIIQDEPRDSPGAYVLRAKAYAQKRDYLRAQLDFETALNQLTEKERRANVHNSRAIMWRDKGELDRALMDYDTAVRLNPSYPKYLSNRGEAWRLKGDLDRAISDQNLAIKKQRTALFLCLRGDTYRYRGEFAKALADYHDATRLTPTYVPAFVGRGLVFERQGELNKARIEFERAVSSPDLDVDITKSARETARARLAALDSGETQPKFPIAPAKFASTTAIPTPALAPPRPLTPERVQATAKQGRRIALVIGNSGYRTVAPLLNPKNDAEVIAASLRSIGFEEVTLLSDATRESLMNALRRFANEADNADWAMVYYAGHGIEVGGVNYLVPVDAKLAVDRDIEYEAVSVSQVLRAADGARKIKLVMLDACRDNPFSPRKTDAPVAVAAGEIATGRSIATRSSGGRGLAEVRVQGATLVVFAAKDGQVALDGEGGNSPFAVAVTQRIATPGVEISKIFRLVRDDVMEATAGRQEPYTYGSLPGREEFFFVTK